MKTSAAHNRIKAHGKRSHSEMTIEKKNSWEITALVHSEKERPADDTYVGGRRIWRSRLSEVDAMKITAAKIKSAMPAEDTALRRYL